MAIDYGPFQFAGAPRTATTWIRHAAYAAGFRQSGFVHVPHDGDGQKIRLSTVRHPADWLKSYYATIWPGQIQVSCVDGLRLLCHGKETFDDLIRKYLLSRWSIGGMFDAYGADVVIRIEDLPWAFVEFLESVGVGRKDRGKCLSVPAVNESKLGRFPRWNPCLRDRVIESEWNMAEKYDYS